MKRFKFIVSLVATAVVLLLVMAACDSGQSKTDQTNSSDAQTRLHSAYPYPVLKTSSELANETKRYHDLNDDPNRVSYLYMMSMDGKIIAEYQIIGKVSSTDSLYASPDALDPYCASTASGYHSGCPVIPQAQPDGSYGANEPGIYFFINDANHTMVEWNGTYLWSLTQLSLQQPPEIVVVPNGK